MKYVTQYGSTWRMTNHNFKRLLQVISDGSGFNLDKFGKMIVEDAVSVSDMDPEEAKELLSDLH